MTHPLKKTLVNLGLLGVTVVVFLGVLELGLRLSGFSYVLYPERIEFGAPDPVYLKDAFLEDDDLFWVTKDYPQKLERLAVRRPRLVFMGDSCTNFGTFDEGLAKLVAARRGRELSWGNVAVAGWSSYQGRRQMERDVAPLEPRVVTVYYGWNDHWVGFGIEDKNVARIKRVFSSRWSGLRVVQLVMKAQVAWGARHTDFPERVSLDDFEDNLRRLVEVARDVGTRPVLLTAPTSTREGEEPAYLAARWLRDLGELLPLHRAYVERVRAVTASEDVALCDLDRLFNELPRGEVEAAFKDDGIHFTDEGSLRVAEMLYGCLEESGLLDVALAP